jgi:hypothetical protein
MSRAVQRVLDLDLDFFVHPVEFNATRDGPRLDPAEFHVCLDHETMLRSVDVETADPLDAALGYLQERVLLGRPVPGASVEHHGEVFALWQKMIQDEVLQPPFHITHVDAHGDFGHGQTSYRNVFDVLRLPLEQRPDRSGELLNDGDYLAHAVACRWVDAIDYVYCPKGGCDIDTWYWENFGTPNWYCRASGTLRLNALDDGAFRDVATPRQKPPLTYTEPRVPFEGIQQRSYESSQPFDFVFLSRSPGFTPLTADTLYDAIRNAYIDEV